MASAQLWLVSLGPDTHPLPEAEAADGNARGVRSFVTQQDLLLGALHSAACAVVSFLPPAAWLVVVPDHADLAALVAAFSDVRMVRVTLVRECWRCRVGACVPC